MPDMPRKGHCKAPTIGADDDEERREVVRESVEKFAGLMEAQLKANDHKGGWWSCSPEMMLMRAVEELGELAHAVINGGNQQMIEQEAADVANFCMMVVEQYRVNWQKQPQSASTEGGKGEEV